MSTNIQNLKNNDNLIEDEINNDLSIVNHTIQSGGKKKKEKNKDTHQNKDTNVNIKNNLINNEQLNLLDDHRQMLINYNPESQHKIGRNKITKYELSNLIGKRATLLAHGADPNIDVKPNMSITEIAEEELRQNKLPLMIERSISNRKDIWKLKDLEK